MSAAPVRVCAARALAEVLQAEKSLATSVPRYSEGLGAKDQALLQELCFGVCRHQQQLALIAQQFLQKPFKSKDCDIEALLYLGIYQLLYTRIPDHAAISATVEAAAKLKKVWAKGMLNGVLRNVQRGVAGFNAQPWADCDAYRYSHPQWFMDAVRAAWPEDWQQILEANNQHPPMTLRINRRYTTREQYLAALASRGIAAQATAFSSEGIQLQQPCSVQLLPDFAEGHVSVQDEAAQLSAHLLELAPGQRVLDACCAPGGKTCHILEREPQLREVVALDLDGKRMERVQENLKRLHLKATLTTADAAELATWWDQQPFTRILLDAPCSATGVIRRHPDIKLLRRAGDIAALAQLQLKLLCRLWQTLAPGGLLVYATCSVLPEENEQVVQRFVEQTEDAQHRVIDAAWGSERPFGRQLLPMSGAADGFYYALLYKSDAATL